MNQQVATALTFADDLLLFAETPDDLQLMLIELYDVSIQVGRKMNTSKTKVIISASGISNLTLTVGNEKLEVVGKYLQIGHILSFNMSIRTKRFQKEFILGGQLWKAGTCPSVRKVTPVPKDPFFLLVCPTNNDTLCRNVDAY